MPTPRHTPRRRPSATPAGIGAVVVGESENFCGGHAWVAEHGCEVVELDDPECTELLGTFIAAHPELWHEDIGL